MEKLMHREAQGMLRLVLARTAALRNEEEGRRRVVT
jgi:hypothetical protein